MNYKQTTTLLAVFLSLTAMGQQELYVLNRADHEIVAYELGAQNNQRAVIRNGSGVLVNPYDMEFDKTTGQMFWSELSQGSIHKGSIEQGASSSLSVESQSAPVDLALDKTNGRLYWLDYAQKKIFSSALDGKEVKAVINDSISKPSCIGISTRFNRLYWVDIEQRKIFVSTLEGGDITELIDMKDGYAVRIFIDEQQELLYWTDDAQHSIYVANLWGGDIREVYVGQENEHPFGLYYDSDESYLYWTDYGTDEVKRIVPFSGQNAEVIVEDANDPIALFIAPKQSNLRSTDEEEIIKEEIELSIAPNPAKNHITIFLSQAIADQGILSIYNQVGQVVKTTPIAAQRMRLEVSELSGGVYICEVKTGDKHLYQQFVLLKE